MSDPLAHSGLFISFEGIDGAGKSTHIARLADAFRVQGRTVTLTREPGGTPLAEKLRLMVLGDPMDPLCEALLMFAARRDHLQQVIEPALASGEVVLCDRFTDATVAYQGFGRGFDLAVLRQLEAWVQALPQGGLRQPELTLWFDLPPETAAARLATARAPDRFESQPVAFFSRVAAGYAHRAQEQPERFVRIASDQPVEAVWTAVRAVFESRGWLTPERSA
jgi:dTMP kinase